MLKQSYVGPCRIHIRETHKRKYYEKIQGVIVSWKAATIYV